MMAPWQVLIFVGGMMVVLFAGLGMVRGEGFQRQIALEIVMVTALAVFLNRLTGVFNPIAFFAVGYVIVMRARILVDLGNALAARDHIDFALSLYDWALRLRPDPAGRLTALVNTAVAYLQQEAPEQAIELLESSLEMPDVVPRYAAASHFNLGVAYRQLGRRHDAIRQFRQAQDIAPMSPYGQRARNALEADAASRHNGR